MKYSDAGVDIDKGNEFVYHIKQMTNSLNNKDVIGGLGGFGGLLSLKTGEIKEPVLVSSTDGVGTKLKIAFMLNKHNTIGIDLVAMVVNDIAVQGAKPLFFLDYFATGKLDIDIAKQVMSGIVSGCMLSDCPLIGGETAEMPGFYKENEYDLSGFSVGIVDREKIIDGSKIKKGDVLIGITSSGLHSNGFSLVRKVLPENPSKKLLEELLTPTRIYVSLIQSVLEKCNINGISHITGGGLIDNIDRLLPEGLKARIDFDWVVPEIFHTIQKYGNIEESEMLRVFNNGIGLVFIVSPKELYDLENTLYYIGEKYLKIGEIV
jgi:phosphoribosylformylglycinamidine cyclo-ligase